MPFTKQEKINRAWNKKQIKKRQRNRKWRRTGRPVKRIALSAALSLKETKRHLQTSTAGFQLWNNSSNWMTLIPLDLDQSTATNSETQREGNIVYANNFRVTFDLEPSPSYINPFYVRIVKGWAKGNASYGATAVTPATQIQPANLHASVPNHYSDFDKDDFKILYDRKTRLAPRQIYDADGSHETTAVQSGLENTVMNALWPNYKRTINFPFNRKYKFEDGYGTSLVGWHPFVAVQIDRTPDGAQFVGATAGSGQSPLLCYDATTYFKDVH